MWSLRFSPSEAGSTTRFGEANPFQSAAPMNCVFQESEATVANRWMCERVVVISAADDNADETTKTGLASGLDLLRYPATALAILVPVALVVAGLGLALASAVLAERASTEAIGAFGVEFGAAMWFAGAVSLGARGGSTLRRTILLSCSAMGGLVLIVLGLVVPWHGVALGLGMEFGVGLIAISIIDIVIIRLLYGTVRDIADDRPLTNPFARRPRRDTIN